MGFIRRVMAVMALIFVVLSPIMILPGTVQALEQCVVKVGNNAGSATDLPDTGDGNHVSQAAATKITLTVTSPKAGDVWEAGSTQTIRWTYTGNIGAEVTISLFSRDANAVPWRPIAQSVKVIPGGNGVYNWVVPQDVPNGTRFYIRIGTYATGQAIYWYSQEFAAKAKPSIPVIRVLLPYSKSTWVQGKPCEITWQCRLKFAGHAVKIELLKGGAVNRVVDQQANANILDSNKYDWRVPEDQSSGRDYQIRITSTTDSSQTATGEYFFIVPAPKPASSINATSPKAGEDWKEGSTQTIRWTYTGVIGPTVNIGLFKAGAALKVIATGVRVVPGGNGAYNWVVTGVPMSGSDYSIKVIGFTANGQIEANSDRFTITRIIGSPGLKR